MKVWKKVLLIISGVAAVIGICCIAVGLVLGVSWQDLRGIITHTSFDRIGDRIEGFWDHTRRDDWEITDRAVQENFSGIRNLEIEADYSSILLQQYEGSGVQVEASGVSDSKYMARREGSTLYVKDETHGNYQGSQINIWIPKDIKLHIVSLDAGAGDIEIDVMEADEFSCEIGGGRLFVSEKLAAKQIECSVEAGQIEVSLLSGDEIDLECGAGQITAQLEGNKEDYRLWAECGLGQILFGDDSYGSISESITKGSGTKEVNLECGVGQIEIQFENE